MKVKFVVAAVVLIAAAVLVINSFTDSLSARVSIAEALQRGTRVQVMGEIDHKKAEYDIEKQVLIFTVTDESGDQMAVVYTGTVPGNFQQASHIVSIGTHNGEYFEADQLLIKCPSKYQGRDFQAEEG